MTKQELTGIARNAAREATSVFLMLRAHGNTYDRALEEWSDAIDHMEDAIDEINAVAEFVETPTTPDGQVDLFTTTID